MLVDVSRKARKTYSKTHELSKNTHKNTKVSRQAYDTKAGQECA
jgi:hypothetical protein